MSNIGKKVLIKDYTARRELNGLIGTIREEHTRVYLVDVPGHEECKPYNGSWETPECILLDNNWYVKGGPALRDVIADYEKVGRMVNIYGNVPSALYYAEDITDVTSFEQCSVGNLPSNRTIELTPDQVAQLMFTIPVLKAVKPEKELLGYRIKGNVTPIQVARLVGCSDELKNGMFFWGSHKEGAAIDMLRNMGVFDLWFEPVYELDTVEICGYVSEVKHDEVSFGCQSFSRRTLLALKDLFSRKEFVFAAQIDEQPVTEEIIDKLLKLLNS